MDTLSNNMNLNIQKINNDDNLSDNIIFDNQNNEDGDDNLSDEPLNEFNLNTKTKKIRNKHKLFPLQRAQLLDTLLSILMNENENTFCSHEIESNEEKKANIEALTEDIKKYFNVSTWSAFKTNQVVEKKTMSTVRSIFKEMNVKCETYSSKKKENDKTINTIIYIVKR